MPVVAPGLLEAYGLYLLRTSVIVIFAPVFGSLQAMPGFRVGMIGVLSIVLFATSGEPLSEPVGYAEYALMAMREIVLGMALAFIAHAVVLAVRVAGEIIGQEMAFTISSQVDPQTGVNTPLITQVYEGLFLLGLLAVNGHFWLVRAMAGSFERAPVGRVGLDLPAVEYAQSVFSEMFSAGLAFAGPIIVLLLLVSLLVGFLARAVPQINVLEMGFTLRIGAGLFAMFMFAPLLEPVSDVLYGMLAERLDGFVDAVEGVGR